MAEKTSASRISFEDFTSATLNSIVRALETHKNVENALIRNPHIIIGIVWTPEFQQEVQGSARQLKR